MFFIGRLKQEAQYINAQILQTSRSISFTSYKILFESR